LRLEGDAVVASGPPAALTPDVVERLRARKLDLLAWLKGDRSRGVRRTSKGILWKLAPAAEPRQRYALM
jgi:hypothetical protein